MVHYYLHTLTLKFSISGWKYWHVYSSVVRVIKSNYAVGTVMSNVSIVIYGDQTSTSATISEVEGRAIAGGHLDVGNQIGMIITWWAGSRDQFGVHKVVHVLAVLAVMSRDSFLDGPCCGKVWEAAISANKNGK